MEPEHSRVLEVINYARLLEDERGRSPEDVYLRGNCANLFYILKEVFPDAEAYGVVRFFKNRIEHIVTKIGGKFYDIRGPWKPQWGIGVHPVRHRWDIRNNTNNYLVNKYIYANPLYFEKINCRSQINKETQRKFESLEQIDRAYFKRDIVKVKNYFTPESPAQIKQNKTQHSLSGQQIKNLNVKF